MDLKTDFCPKSTLKVERVPPRRNEKRSIVAPFPSPSRLHSSSLFEFFSAMYPSYSPEVDDPPCRDQDSDSSLSSLSSDDDHQQAASASSPFLLLLPSHQLLLSLRWFLSLRRLSSYRDTSRASRVRQGSLGYPNCPLNNGSTIGREQALKVMESKEYVERFGLKMVEALESLKDEQ